MGKQDTDSNKENHEINDETPPSFKVSIVTAMTKHTECIGFLCEALKDHEITVYLNGTIRYCYIDYFIYI